MRDVKETCILGGLAALVATMSMLLASPPPADASPLCERRSAAHVAEHGGIHEDSRWHIARGELPNCDEESKGSDHNTDGKSSRDYDDNDKSRFCKRKFYC